MQITLNSGREIYLQDLNQSHSYAGLLLGLPNREYNLDLIRQFRQTAMKEMHTRYVFVVTPPVLDFVDADGEKRTRSRRGPVERIPDIACTARFYSSGVVREGDEDIAFASVMTVVWFQETFALPIDEMAMEHIKAIDWDRLADAWIF
jgi:hypothetical protein